MKERNGRGKILGKIGELGRGQQLPSAHYFRLSLVHVTYCFRSAARKKKERKEWTKAIDTVNDRIFQRHRLSINSFICDLTSATILSNEFFTFSWICATVRLRGKVDAMKRKKVVQICNETSLKVKSDVFGSPRFSEIVSTGDQFVAWKLTVATYYC